MSAYRILSLMASMPLALGPVAVAAGQTVTEPVPVATATAPVPIPAAPVIALPTPTPTSTPAPSAAPDPAETFRFQPNTRATTAARARPVEATQAPADASTPTPRATEVPAPTPAVTVSAAAASPTSLPAAPPVPAPVAPVSEDAAGGDWLVWLAGAAAIALFALLWVRSRRDSSDAPVAAEEIGDAAVAPPLPPTVPPRVAAPGPWLTIALRPMRAGLNMITAVADCEITVANEGNIAVEAIRTGITLIAAHADQSTEIDEINAGQITRPVVPTFALAPGESRTFRTVASAPLDTLRTMRVGEQGGGREMLVPLVVLNLLHRDAKGEDYRTSQTFVLGVERVDSPKLAPFWMDSIRMIEQVAARASGATLRRRA